MMTKEKIQQHEKLLAETFIAKSQKERFISLLKSNKGRVKLRHMLPHSVRFNKNFIVIIPNGQQTTDQIHQILLTKNAQPICHIISEHTDLDRKILELKEALDCVVGSGIATIISCNPGKLAYYEGEDKNDRIILEKI